MFNEKWRFFKCSGSPKEFYLRDRRYIYFNIYHVPWSQDLCSLIGAIYENSFHGSSATFVEDTFREIQDDIFNNFGDPGKAVAQTARSILWQVNNKAYVLQEYNQHLADQYFELVNFTGTKCVDKEKMFSLFLQRAWTHLEEKMGRIFVKKMVLKHVQKK